jgi:hypothetical protein
MASLELWSLIDTVPTHLPFSVGALEAALGVAFSLDGEHEYFRFYKAGGLALCDGVVIESLDLRIKKEQPHPGFLVLTLAGTCVARAEVMRRYDGLRLTEYPRGRSLDEEAHYSRHEPWGDLSFGFSERARDCLRSIVFNPAP